jgi:hypothetical protein
MLWNILISHTRAWEIQDAVNDHFRMLIDESMTGIRDDFYLHFW